MTEGSVEVLPPKKVIGRPFVKGQSGNVTGRPKNESSKPFQTALRLALELGHGKKRSRRLRDIAERLVKAAEKGEKWAIIEVIDRVDGKATTTALFGSDAASPLAITVRHVLPGRENG
jgi:hypothetical protein